MEKILQLAQRTDAPRSTSVSISTAVSMVMCSEPVMRTPLSGFCGAVFFADGHQAGHFVLGDVDFFAAPFGEADVFDFVIVAARCRFRFVSKAVSAVWSKCFGAISG